MGSILDGENPWAVNQGLMVIRNSVTVRRNVGGGRPLGPRRVGAQLRGLHPMGLDPKAPCMIRDPDPEPASVACSACRVSPN